VRGILDRLDRLSVTGPLDSHSGTHSGTGPLGSHKERQRKRPARRPVQKALLIDCTLMAALRAFLDKVSSACCRPASSVIGALAGASYGHKRA
jgi:hypothetical protein